MWSSSLGLLRIVGIIEGISYLILLFIAMPLKYWAGQPIFVRVFGMAHGILFVLFVLMLMVVWFDRRWSFTRVLVAFLASLLPFGNFVLDARLRKDLC